VDEEQPEAPVNAEIAFPTTRPADAVIVKKETPRSLTRMFIEIAAVFVGFVVLTLTIKTFVMQTYEIPSESMVPTLNIGDKVFVNKLSYRLGGGPERGDIVVFDRPAKAVSTEANAPPVLIKRVVGVPGDIVEARGGILYVNGTPLNESGSRGYLPANVVTNNLPEPVTVPAGSVFLMGDNREQSNDSRYFGPVKISTIVGRAVLVSDSIFSYHGLSK
jgi:signal peptidase I